MDPTTNSDEPRTDEDKLTAFAETLAVAVDDVVPTWIEALVLRRLEEWRGIVTPADRALAAAAGRAAAADVVPKVASLLRTDIDEQEANPLALLRTATRHATDALRGIGTPPMHRDAFAERAFPDDVYDLAPATWSDIAPELHEPGLSWSAAKAFVFKARRRAEGRT